MNWRLLATSFGIAASLCFVPGAWGQESSKAAPSEPKSKADEAKKVEPKMEKAVFGGGCFWCLEAFYERVHGVKSVTSGYAGGTVARPTYEMVQTGETGHAEVVGIEYDANVVAYDDLLDIFWICHDPTTLNRQGADVGAEYRSIILYENDEQKAIAEKSYQKATAAGLYPNPIVTQLVPLVKFWPAEKHHQDFYRRNGNKNSYCQSVIAPKLEHLKAKLNAKSTKAKPADTAK